MEQKVPNYRRLARAAYDQMLSVVVLHLFRFGTKSDVGSTRGVGLLCENTFGRKPASGQGACPGREPGMNPFRQNMRQERVTLKSSEHA